MNSTLKKYLFFLGLATVLILIIDYNKPKPINWRPTFSIDDKIPFGLYLLNQEIDSLVKDQKILRYNQSVFEFISDTLLQDSIGTKTLLLIESNSSIDYLDTRSVLDFVRQGNTVFAISNSFPQNLTDTLKLEEYTFGETNKTIVWTTNQNLTRQQFNLDKAYSYSYFKKVDPLQTTVLGYQTNSNLPMAPNFIRVPFGKGYFIFNTQPNAFTNYSLLESNNHLYAENVLSYLPKQSVYWKVYQNDNATAEVVSQSPLRFILQNPPLKWAWYFLLLGLVTFALFTAKRKQRTIPILKPLTNTTVEFTKTISNLYLATADYPDLMDKIILHALLKIRRVYHIDTHKLDSHFIQTLHKMTAKDISKIEKWVALICQHQQNPSASTQASAIALHTLTEEILN